jgi:hypothetical protein
VWCGVSGQMGERKAQVETAQDWSWLGGSPESWVNENKHSPPASGDEFEFTSGEGRLSIARLS